MRRRTACGWAAMSYAGHRGPPAGGGEQRAQHLHGGRLPGPVGAEQAVDLTSVDGEVEAVDRGHLPEGAGEALGGDGGRVPVGRVVVLVLVGAPGRLASQWLSAWLRTYGSLRPDPGRNLVGIFSRVQTAATAGTHRAAKGAMADNDPTERALLLLSLLQTHRFWPGEELTERLGVSARTLRRDVDRLRSLGYPVDATPGSRRRLPPRRRRPPAAAPARRRRSRRHRRRAADGRRARRSTGMEDTALRALAKLEQVLPDRLRRRVLAVHTNVVSLQWWTAGPSVDADALAVLALACRDREQVRFDYRRRDGDDSSRLVEPHQLVSTGRRWYLVAWDVRRDDWRTFRLDRLERPRLRRRAVRGARAPGWRRGRVRGRSRSARCPNRTYAVLEVDARRRRRARRAPLGRRRSSSRARRRSGAACASKRSSDDALLRVVTWLAGRYPVVGRRTRPSSWSRRRRRRTLGGAACG